MRDGSLTSEHPRLWNLTQNRRVAGRVYRASGRVQAGLGLLARPPLGPGEALLLQPGGSIHTCGLRYPIDVLFLDREGLVLRVARGVRSWRVALAPWGTHRVVELREGEARDVDVGDLLQVRDEP